MHSRTVASGDRVKGELERCSNRQVGYPDDHGDRSVSGRSFIAMWLQSGHTVAVCGAGQAGECVQVSRQSSE